MLALGCRGLNRVDVVAQVHALQAKVAALLLHPRRHPWKVLMLAAAFTRQVPDSAGWSPAGCGSGRLDRHVARGTGGRLVHNLRLLRPRAPLAAGGKVASVARAA